MKWQHSPEFPAARAFRPAIRALAALVAVTGVALADIPRRPLERPAAVQRRAAAESGVLTGRFHGIYKVASSTDPMFPDVGTSEYFLDFGRGVRADQKSGSVAVSQRRNPNVRVRVMAWEYLPGNESLLIGNPYAEGSRRAVAAGVWKIRLAGGGAILERGNARIVLRRAAEGEY